MPPNFPASLVNLAQPGSCGILDLSAGTSDMMMDILYVGKGRNAAGGGYAAGVFNMGAGTLNVNTLGLGVLSVSSATANKVAMGTFTVPAGANVVVNSQLALGQAFSGGKSIYAWGTLNVGGTLSAGTIVSSGLSQILLTNGTISLTSVAGSIGTAEAPIGWITLANSTLNLAVGGPGVAVVTSNLTISGTSDIINVSEMPLIASVPTTVTLIQSLTPFNGTYDFVLGGPLPAGYTGSLQESADHTAVQLLVTGAPFASTGAKITAASFQPETGSLVISGTSGLANSVYYVLTSTNAALPRANWTVIGVSTFGSSGDFSTSLPYSASDSGRFYTIKSQ